jgi:hypothetical protein
MMVYVINVGGEPLMPCTPVVARLLLKGGNAKVKLVMPFTITLTREPSSKHVDRLTLGIDAGSKTAGFAASDRQGNVYYASRVELRDDIVDKMDRRRKYRRARRSRKCRYRQPRFDNRRNSIKDGRIPQSIRSKVASHDKEIAFIKKLLPVSEVIIEVGTFDPHAIADPSVLDDLSLYQHGPRFGFYNTRAFVLHRDGYTCQQCHGRSHDSHLHVHHVVYRDDNGSDDPANLVTLCKACHDAVHDGFITLNLAGLHRRAGTRHATHFNVVRSQLVKQHPEASQTFGYVTKARRESLGLPKEHHVDASVIASRGAPVTFVQGIVIIKKCVPRGDYQQSKGVRSERRIPTRKLHGFRKFDKVRYRGIECFIKGRRSTGYFSLMAIDGKELPFRPIPKASLIQRLEARTTWLTTTMAC